CLVQRGRRWIIRWRELEIAPDGSTRRVLRFESLGTISRREASERLAEKIAATSNGKPTRSRVAFDTLAAEWQTSVLPLYKHSTQKSRRFMLRKHLLPRFGKHAISEITRQEIQAYVTQLSQQGYAPKTVDQVHDVLSAVLRTAVTWGHIAENPASNVNMPALK